MTMPHAATIPGTHTAASPPYQTIARFLDTIYGAESGYCCLGSINGDPQFEDMQQEWYIWPRDRRTVIQRHIDLTQRGINVYTGRCLFSTQKRSYATAQPSRWLWLDDAACDTDATLLIETSAQNYQAWLQLAHPITADEASQLQRRWRQAAGADSCSADAVHMVRVPGGINTKRHGCFPVTMAQQTGMTYHLADLPWPPLPDTPDTLPAINLAQVETQRADLRPLLNEYGIPRRFKPHMQSYKVLTGEIVVHNRAGTADQSDPRYWITKGLAYCRYTYEDAYTILLALTDSTWLTQKGFDWHHTDILRCITKAYQEVRTQIAQKRQDWKALPLTAREQAYGSAQAPPDALPYTTRRKRRGRPSRITPADVLGYWQNQAAGNRCIYTRKEMANALHISVRALDRHIKHLKDTGTAIIETPVHRQYSVAIFQEVQETERLPNLAKDAVLGTAINTNEAPVSPQNEVLPTHTDAAQPDAENMRTYEHKGTHPPAGSTDTTTVDNTGVCSSDHHAGYPAIWHAHDSDIPVTVVGHLGMGPDGRAYVAIADSTTGIPLDEVTFTQSSPPPEQVPTPSPAISLAEAVAEAFDAITTKQRKTKDIRTYLELNYPDVLRSDSALTHQIAYERKRRKLAILHDLKVNGLKSELRLAEHKAQKSRDCGTNEWRWWDFYASQVRAELNRRPQRKRAPRKLCEAVPDVRQVAQEHEARQVALWQEELDYLLGRAHYAHTPVIRTVPLSPSVPPPPPAKQYDAQGMIARLRQRQGVSAA